MLAQLLGPDRVRFLTRLFGEVVASSELVLRVQVLGANGETLAEIELGGSAGGIVEFEWDGKLADGSQAPPGVYTVTATAGIDGDEQLLQTLSVANVNSVTLGSGANDVLLDLGALGEIPISDVRRIG